MYVLNEESSVIAMGRKKTTRDNSATQQHLMKAALDLISDKGIDGATARAIADKAGVNQSLVFYYFGSVTGLVIAAVSDMSARRFTTYQESLAGVDTIAEATTKLFDVFVDDRKSCSFMILSQFVAGAQNNDEIAAAVEQVFTPWITLTHDTLVRVLSNAKLPNDISYDDVSMALMSLFMGVQFMASIPAYENRVEELIEKIPSMAPMFSLAPMLMGSLGAKPQ